MNSRKYRRMCVILSLLLGTPSVQTFAQGNVGFGFVLGNPSGLAWNYRMNQANSVAGTIGFSHDDRFRIDIDYLWYSHFFQDEQFELHYGAGLALGTGRRTDLASDRGNGSLFRSGDVGFGVRTVIGVTYLIPKSPFDAFVEVAPLFVVSPAADIGLDIGIGVRVYP